MMRLTLLTTSRDGDTLKDDIVEQLDDYLQKNATRLSRNSSFEPYYTTRRTPFKARSSSGAGLTSDDGGAVKSVVKAGGKRKTAVKSEECAAPIPRLLNMR